jgi:hypothetical protein
MKKQELKQLIKECIKSVISEMDISNPNPESDDMPYEPRDRTEPSIEPEKPDVDKNKIKMLNDILVTCGDMQKRVHSLTDRVIINGIRNIQDTTIELMKSLGAK